MSEAQHTEGRLIFGRAQLFHCWDVPLASCRDGMSRERLSFQLLASLMLLFWPQALVQLLDLKLCAPVSPHLCASVSQGPQCCTHFGSPGSLWDAGIQIPLGYLGKIICTGCELLVLFWGSNSQTLSSPCMDLSVESVCAGVRLSVTIKK